MDTLILTLYFVAALVVYGVVAVWLDNCRLRRLANERDSESICTFGRSLDYRRLDTKVIRGVYEQVQDYFSFLGVQLPVRPTDRFEEDLNMDSEDLDGLAVDLAERTGRSFDDVERNPYFGSVATVGDLVEFLCLQPLLQNNQAEQGVDDQRTARREQNF